MRKRADRNFRRKKKKKKSLIMCMIETIFNHTTVWSILIERKRKAFGIAVATKLSESLSKNLSVVPSHNGITLWAWRKLIWPWIKLILLVRALLAMIFCVEPNIAHSRILNQFIISTPVHNVPSILLVLWALTET